MMITLEKMSLQGFLFLARIISLPRGMLKMIKETYFFFLLVSLPRGWLKSEVKAYFFFIVSFSAWVLV